LRALIENDIGALYALDGNAAEAAIHFDRALTFDSRCETARLNRLLIEDAHERMSHDAKNVVTNVAPASCGTIAILSFLFNWPSTGGGIIHTVELAKFLALAGFSVHLIHPQFPSWGIGTVDETCPVETEPLPFEENEWQIEGIKSRFRAAVERINPDAVVITDCWNFKPHLAEAVRGFPYFLRMQAQECLCPLNNLRLKPIPAGLQQCPNHQFLSRATCRKCLEQNGPFSGNLHQAERCLSQVERDEYGPLLSKAFQEAEAVLVLNRATGELIRPYAGRVEVVTWGMDPSRFPAPSPRSEPKRRSRRNCRILFAGLVDEPIKGFANLLEACRKLWKVRHDFELVVTAEPRASDQEPFLQFVGWKSQGELPQLYASADIVVVPTIAQEGLSRTAVEAMASGCAVIGSRIGGLMDTIDDGRNGLFCEPGNVEGLHERIAYLLDRPGKRAEFGAAARAKFERHYTWPRVIEQKYRPLLSQCVGRRSRGGEKSSSAPSRAIGNDPVLGRAGGKRPLKMLFLENFSDFNNQNQFLIADTLRDLGHTVIQRDEFSVLSADALVAEINDGDVDCLLFGKGRISAKTTDERLRPSGDEIADVLRRCRKPAYLWYGDKVLDFEPSRLAWMRKVAPLCRLAFVTDGELAQQRWAEFRLLRQGVLAQTVVRPNVQEKEKRDIAFIGSIYGDRASELSPVFARYDVTHVSNQFGTDLSRLIQTHRIVIGPRFPSSPGYWSDRIYVVLGHGGFFLAPEVPGMREEGLLPGMHYAATSENLVRDIEHWLARPDEREKIAKAGQKLALSRFTYHHRLRELCDAIQETLQ
jgi:glycosyltransferase involved in cell wall biosynthesis